MKEILSCSYLCFCSAKLRFFKLCKFSFWKGKPLFYRFLWYYRFFCFLLFAIFSAFLHRSFCSKSPFSSEKSHHARHTRLDFFASRNVALERNFDFQSAGMPRIGWGRRFGIYSSEYSSEYLSEFVRTPLKPKIFVLFVSEIGFLSLLLRDF